MRFFFITLLLLTLFINRNAAQPQAVWTRMLHGQDQDIVGIRDLCTDVHGNVYSAGIYLGFVDLDPGSSNNTDSTVTQAFYILKQDPAGQLVWRNLLDLTAFPDTNAGVSSGPVVAVDKLGNVYFAGTYDRTMDFDPGINSFTLTPQAWQEMYLCKLNPLGQFQWVRSFGGKGSSQSYALDLKVDELGNPIICGRYGFGAIDFDPGPGVSTYTSYGGDDFFVLKLDSAGNYKWLNTLNANGQLNGLSTDKQNNIFVTGYYYGNLTIPGTNPITYLNAQGSADMLLMKISSAGQIQWAKGIGGTGPGSNPSMGMDIDLDQNKNIYVGGSFHYTIDIEPGTAQSWLVAHGESDGCLLKFDSLGNLQWGKVIGSGDYDHVNGIECMPNGDVYWSGDFSDTIDLDPGVPTAFEYPAPSLNPNYKSVMAGGLTSAGNYICGGSLPGGYGGFAQSNNQYLVIGGGFALPGDFQMGPGVQTFTPNGEWDAYLMKFQTCLDVTSIMEIESRKTITLFPHPNNGKFKITGLEDDLSTIEIINCSGQLVSKMEITKDAQIDAGFLTAGVYIVRVYYSDGVQILKLVKG